MIIAVSDMMQNTISAGLTMFGLGFIFALVLLVASIKLKVTVDPKVEEVQAALPGVDCGACGFAGCGSYARAVVNNADLLGKCAPAGADVSARIAEILNLQVSGSGAPQRPIIYCRGHMDDKKFYCSYTGIASCTAANAQPNVQACKFGCMGYGDCTLVCKFDALHVIDGLVTVDYEKCTGCGACAKACPRFIIEMVPFTYENMMTVACSSRENGKSTRSFCSVGCIGCKMCSKQTGAFIIEDNLARMDFEKYLPGEDFETAMNKCPTGVILYRGKNAPEPRPSAKSS